MIDKQAARMIFGEVEIKTIEKRLKGIPLTQTERNYLSKSIKPKIIAAKLLTESNLIRSIYKKINHKPIILYNLRRYGYEMMTILPSKRRKRLEIEQLIAEILVSCPDARFIESVPILMLKNKFSKFKLAELAIKEGIANKIGYLAEIAQFIAERKGIKKDFGDLIKYLENSKGTEITTLSGAKDSISIEFYRHTTPERLKKWNLLGRFFDDDFIALAGTYL
jgi:hypothetical protein